MYKTFNNVKLYDLDSLHEILGLSKVSIRAYIKRGLIKARKIGIKWYVTEQNLLDFISQNQNSGQTDVLAAFEQHDTSLSQQPEKIFTSSHLYPSGRAELFKNNGNIDLTKVLPLEAVAESWEFWLDKNHRLTYTSPLCEKITGYNSIEFLQNPGLLMQVIYEEDKSKFLQHLQNAPANQEIKIRIIAKTGNVKLILVKSKKVYAQNGELMGTQINCRDITNDLIISDNKSLLNQFISNVANELDLLVVILDEDLKVIAYNNQAYVFSLVALNKELFIGANILELIPDRYKSEDQTLLEKVLAGGSVRVLRQAYLFDNTITKRYLLHIFLTQYRNPNSKDICILLEDIDNQLLRLHNVEYSIEQYFEKYNDINAIVIGSNSEQRILFANRYALNVTGWSQDEVIGKSIRDFMNEEDLSNLPEKTEVFWKTGVNFGFPMRIKCKNGSWLEVKIISFLERSFKEPIAVSFMQVKE